MFGSLARMSVTKCICGLICQLSLLPSTGWEMSSGQSVVMHCSWGVKVGIAHSTCKCTCEWQVKLCDSSLARANPEHFDGELVSIRRYTSVLFTC